MVIDVLKQIKSLISSNRNQIKKQEHSHGDPYIITTGLVIHSIADGVSLGASLFCKWHFLFSYFGYSQYDDEQNRVEQKERRFGDHHFYSHPNSQDPSFHWPWIFPWKSVQKWLGRNQKAFTRIHFDVSFSMHYNIFSIV